MKLLTIKFKLITLSFLCLMALALTVPSVYAQDGGGNEGNSGNGSGNGNEGNSNTCDPNQNGGATGCDPGSPPQPDFDGHVYSQTGVVLPGATVMFTFNSNCGSANGARNTDGNGKYVREAQSGVVAACGPVTLTATYNGQSCGQKSVPLSDSVAHYTNDFTCNIPPACGQVCTSPASCAGAQGNCSFCLPNPNNPSQNTCQTQPTCGQNCTTPASCTGAQGECTSCLPSLTNASQKTCQTRPICGQRCITPASCDGAQGGCTNCAADPSNPSQTICQPPPPPPQCGTPCTNPASCDGAANNCSYCLPDPNNANSKICQGQPRCGQQCSSPAGCAGAQGSCTSCIPNLSNPLQNTCQTTPRCGSDCVSQASCVGAEGGCTSCISNGSGAKCGTCPTGTNYNATTRKCECPNPAETYPHGVCDGDKCTNVNSCGVTECTTDKQCFAEEMCKCDGFDAVTLEYPSSKPFEFNAYAKIEGLDISKAIVAGIQFKMSESDRTNPNAGSIIAQSPVYTPIIDSQIAGKVRFKATWSMTPPVVKPNKTYRVFSEIKCKPKTTRRLTDASDPNQRQSTVLGVSTATAKNDLQLKTLNFIKKGPTDNCRFLFFEYDQGI